MRTEKPSTHFRFFYDLVKPYPFDLLKTLIAVITTTAAILMTGYGLRHLVDLGFRRDNVEIVNISVLAFLTLSSLLALSAFMRTSTTAMLAEKVTNDLRKTVFSHILSLKQSVCERQNSGDLLSTLSVDIEQIRQFISGSAAVAIRTLLQIIGASLLLIMQSPKLAIYLFWGLPVVFLPIIIFGRRVKQLSSRVQDEEGEALSYAKERLSDLMTVKAFQGEKTTFQNFSALLDRKLSIALHRTRVRSFVIAMVIFLVFSGIAGILWIGAYEVIQGQLSAGQLSAFIFYAAIVAGSVNNFTDVFATYTQALGGKARIQKIMTLTKEATPNSVQSEPFQQLSLKHINFRYPQRPDTLVFDDLSFDLKQGETLALVGTSGVGKSTILKILLGLYEPETGHVEINDRPIGRDMMPAYRHLFSLVPQDPLIFHASLWENIQFANPHATQKDIEAVMHIAHVDQFVNQFEQGLHTIVGDRGVRLSGGQRQRLALARALLRDAPIMLLDEATNALDSDSEYHIQQAMSEVLKQKSAIIIAHRLSTIKEVDRILVMGPGGIIASGRHEDLIKTSKVYAKLASQQFIE